jgi:hypothetical protein
MIASFRGLHGPFGQPDIPWFLWFIGYPVFIALAVLITVTRSRWMLVLGYVCFIIVVLLAGKGCSSDELVIAAP